eukprot:1556351-Rhodomonas_salina.1
MVLSPMDCHATQSYRATHSLCAVQYRLYAPRTALCGTDLGHAVPGFREAGVGGAAAGRPPSPQHQRSPQQHR